MAAVDYFLKLEGIEGESTDDKHKDWIDLESFSWGANNSAHMGSGTTGLATGKVSMQDFHFVMRVNKSSPKLMLACASGQHIKTANLICRKAGGSQQEYLKYKFTDVLVSSYQTGGSHGEAIPVDQVSLAFGKIEVTYSPQKVDGTLGPPIITGWDLAKNIKV